MFGAPKSRLPEMKEQIKVGSTVFLYNTRTRSVMGPYMATSEPGLWLEKDAWKDSDRKFATQVRVHAQGPARKWPLARLATAPRSGAMTEQEVKAGKQTQSYVFHSKYATSRRPMARAKEKMESHMLTEEETTKEEAVEAEASVGGPQAASGKGGQGGGKGKGMGKGKSGSKERPVQGKSGQGKVIRGQDGKAHETPRPKAAQPQQVNNPGQGGTQ